MYGVDNSSSSGHTVWWDGSKWCWKAWFGGFTESGSQEWPLDAELRAIEWIGMQGRDPLSKVLEDVHRLRKERPDFYGGEVATGGISSGEPYAE